MYTVTDIFSTEALEESHLQQAQRFEHNRPKSPARCDVEAKITRPDFQLEIRRYFWDKPLEPTLFDHDMCYLELSLSSRPHTEINYLADTQPATFVPMGNCSFIPAGHKALVRGSQGEHRVVGCLFDAKVFKPFIDWEWDPLELAACYNISNINIHHAMIRLSQEVLRPEYHSSTLVDSLFRYLLVELARHIRAARNNDRDSGKIPLSKLRVIETIIADTVGVFPKTAWLAEQCGLSPRHLARLFKQTTGKTLTDYITEIRINRAKLKLLNSSLLIKEIAYECGFKSQSAFAQTFKKATDYTPRQYRNHQSRGD